MKRILKGRPSPALAVSFLALFVALGGVSYAVATGSIDSREIKNRTIRGNDLRANAITEREIRRRSLDGTDIKVERVGGNAVKEQVLELNKLGKVPAAELADAAGVANDLTPEGATKYLERWALIGSNGMILEQTGGFTLVNCYQANANCYIDTGDEDVRDNGVWAEIATDNTLNPGPDGAEQLTGTTSVAPCFFDFVNCGPDRTDSTNGGDDGVLVVTPRNADGTMPPADDRYGFYVYVSGQESQ